MISERAVVGSWQGKAKYSEELRPSAILSITNLTKFGIEPEQPRWESSD
jgi:hypothetical protein